MFSRASWPVACPRLFAGSTCAIYHGVQAYTAGLLPLLTILALIRGARLDATFSQDDLSGEECFNLSCFMQEIQMVVRFKSS